MEVKSETLDLLKFLDEPNLIGSHSQLNSSSFIGSVHFIALVCRMGKTHADKVRMEVAKAANGVYRTLQPNGRRPAVDSSSWRNEARDVASSSTTRSLADFIVTKG